MNSYEITIPGEPKAKARPRLARGNHTYTPKSTVDYENHVRFCYLQQIDKEPTKDPVIMHIKAYFKIPKSASEKNKEQMRLGQLRPVKKPDIDNVIKAIADSLNNYAYCDDTQIVEVTAEKHYADEPKVVVTLRGLQ